MRSIMPALERILMDRDGSSVVSGLPHDVILPLINVANAGELTPIHIVGARRIYAG
ncbi:MAG: hypothetical protein R2851_19220 [Caldilineaceae bacterium]